MIRRLVGLLVLVALASGCGETGGPGSPGGPGSGSPEVTMEQAVADLEALRGEIIVGLVAALGRPRWRTSPASGADGAACPHTRVAGGEFRYLPRSVLDAGYRDRDWARAAAVVRRVAERHGFTDFVSGVDRPGTHLLEGRAPDGARLSFAVVRAATLQLRTGCHTAGEPSG